MTRPKSSLRAFVYSPLPVEIVGWATGTYGYVKETVTTTTVKTTTAKKAMKRRFLLQQRKRLRIDNPWQDEGLHAVMRREAVATIKAWAGAKPVTADMFVELDESDAH